MSRRALIQGAGGGIGGALVSRLLEGRSFGDGWEVVAACRASHRPELDALEERFPGRLQRIALDLEDPESIEAAARSVEGPLDVLINASGLLHDATLRPEKRVEALDPAALAKSFAVNAIGPMLVLRAFLPQICAAPNALVGNLSARVGSIADNRLGGWYGYRSSKAALNQLTRTFAIELRRRAPGAIVVALHPGTVETGLSKPFRGGPPPQERFTPERAAEHLLEVLDGLSPADTGSFFAWDGSRIEW